MMESVAYLIANPVEARAVRYAKDWPGAHTLPAWTAGDRSACFPDGTWWMRVCHGAR